MSGVIVVDAGRSRSTCLDVPLLAKMLVPAPYQAPEKKAKKKGKETRSGVCRKGSSDAMSEDSEASSSHDKDVEEGE